MTEAGSVKVLVDKLRDELEISLSFIEHEVDELLTLPSYEQTVGEVLQAVADQHGHYRCEAYADRLVLRSTDGLFDTLIPGIDVVEMYRFRALYAYLDHLQAFGPSFDDWIGPLVATSGDGSPLFEDRVTLSPRAPVVLHLVQLLGRNPAVYFDVPAASEDFPRRTVRLGMLRQPSERIPPLATPHPKEETHENS